MIPSIAPGARSGAYTVPPAPYAARSERAVSAWSRLQGTHPGTSKLRCAPADWRRVRARDSASAPAAASRAASYQAQLPPLSAPLLASRRAPRATARQRCGPAIVTRVVAFLRLRIKMDVTWYSCFWTSTQYTCHVPVSRHVGQKHFPLALALLICPSRPPSPNNPVPRHRRSGTPARAAPQVTPRRVPAPAPRAASRRVIGPLGCYESGYLFSELSKQACFFIHTWTGPAALSAGATGRVAHLWRARNAH